MLARALDFSNLLSARNSRKAISFKTKENAAKAVVTAAKIAQKKLFSPPSFRARSTHATAQQATTTTATDSRSVYLVPSMANEHITVKGVVAWSINDIIKVVR
mmetsp:Transcript_65523/g.156685  ORF Transcript_65523/g.156685 Transcript_65523/m.156685 type:complete len:103 (-) Transcript_65523:464-772(-)